MSAIVHGCCPVHGLGALSAGQGLAQVRQLRRALARVEPTDSSTVPQEAIDYFRGKGVQPGFSYLDVWREEHAYAFTVAREIRLDVLADVRDSLDKALVEGQSFRTWEKALTPTLRAHGWEGPIKHRLRTIFDTNMRVARAAGHWRRVQRTKDERPFLLYRLGPSRVHRVDHVSWNGVLLHVDDPFWATHYPPNGWGCKCYVRQVSAAQAERMGGVTERPDTTPVEVEVRGERILVPPGIDVGWDFNPGALRAAPRTSTPKPAPKSPAKDRPAAPRFERIPDKPADLASFLGDEEAIMQHRDALEPNTVAWELEEATAKQIALEHRTRWKPGDETSTRALGVRMSDALTRSGRKAGRDVPKMRGHMRQLVGGAIPDIVSRDLVRKKRRPGSHSAEPPRPRADEFRVAAAMPDDAAAYHSFGGKAALGRLASLSLKADVADLAAGRRPDIMRGLHAAAHEELHGYSPIFAQATGRRFSLALEEVTTELLARRVMRALLGKRSTSQYYGAAYSGAYQRIIERAIGAVHRKLPSLAGTDLAKQRVKVIGLIEEAAIAMRRPGRAAAVDSYEHLRIFSEEAARLAGDDLSVVHDLITELANELPKGF